MFLSIVFGWTARCFLLRPQSVLTTILVFIYLYCIPMAEYSICMDRLLLTTKKYRPDAILFRDLNNTQTLTTSLSYVHILPKYGQVICQVFIWLISAESIKNLNHEYPTVVLDKAELTEDADDFTKVSPSAVQVLNKLQWIICSSIWIGFGITLLLNTYFLHIKQQLDAFVSFSVDI